MIRRSILDWNVGILFELDFLAALQIPWMPWVQMGFGRKLCVKIFVFKSSSEDLLRIFLSGDSLEK